MLHRLLVCVVSASSLRTETISVPASNTQFLTLNSRHSPFRALIWKDRDVKIIENGRERIMKAIGINEVGALIVEDSDGRQETVISGEVSVRGLYGYV